MWMIYYRFMDLRDIVLKYISVQFFYSLVAVMKYMIYEHIQTYGPHLCVQIFFFFLWLIDCPHSVWLGKRF